MKEKKKGFFLFLTSFCLLLSVPLARAPCLKLLSLLLVYARERRRFCPLFLHMSSTKLTGLSANAGSGSDNDDEAKPSSSSCRSIVVAIEKTDDGLAAVKFAAENVLKGEVREYSGARERVEDEPSS